MVKKGVVLLAALVVGIGFSAQLFATETGNLRKGKYTYRKVYEACQARGAVESVKPKLNPDSHTQAEWTLIFKEKKFDEFGCREEWNALSPEQIRDIYAYLFNHASDSPTPAKCK
ncbi:MAG: cytochrome c family protein [Thermodesulfobacteriota bacterium]